MEAITPSTTTSEQIEKAVANYRAMLEKYSKEFDAATVKIVLDQKELAEEQLAVFRARVEMFGIMIIRQVTVTCRNPQKALDATGLVQYVDKDVVVSMPTGAGGQEEVFLFRVGLNLSNEEVEVELIRRGLIAVDPYTLAKLNTDDPAFADAHPNCTQWKNTAGKWCCAAFNRMGGERYVHVGRPRNDWGGYWWFAGVRPSTQG